MRFNLYSACLSVLAAASSLPDDREAYANYLMAQVEEGELSDTDIIALAQAYDDEHEGSFGDYTVFNQIDDEVLDEVFAQNDVKPVAHAETKAQPIREDLGKAKNAIGRFGSWLGSKAKAAGSAALGAAKKVGGAIEKGADFVYDGAKSVGGKVLAAPGKAYAAAKKWQKDHNFSQAHARSADRPKRHSQTASNVGAHSNVGANAHAAAIAETAANVQAAIKAHGGAQPHAHAHAQPAHR